MKTLKKINPGEAGSKKLMKRYGDALVCVRYRYDADRQRRFTTVELIVDEGEWQKRNTSYKPDDIVYLKVSYGEVSVGVLIRQAGGNWNGSIGYWELPYERVVALNLEHRIAEV
ncbi:MAG: hypothetical protein R3C41_22280 [Calditrichia bacterium]